MKIDVSALLKKAPSINANAAVTTINSSGNTYSVGIVNSFDNGKRVTISKSLAKKLVLTDTVSVLPMTDDGVVLFAKELPFTATSTVKLSGKDKKIIYSAPLVQMLTSAFGLDFSARTSMAFNEVEFEDLNGVTVAAVRIYNKATDSAQNTTTN